MPVALPEFDDRAWEDLVAEGRGMLPARAPDWTDHNASDPGITLLELFAFLTEILIYRANRIPDRHRLRFLHLINGPHWHCREDLEECIRLTIASLSEVHRAVTAADFELLAGRVPGVGRAWCLPNRDLSRMDQAAAGVLTEGHVGVLIVPDPHHERSSGDLLQAVREALEPARLLGTRIRVALPRFVAVQVRAVLETFPGVSLADVRGSAAKRLRAFFDPVIGGSDGQGWPVGGSVYVSEVCQVLQRTPGVKAVRNAIDPSTKRPGFFLSVRPGDERRLVLNRLRDLEAVALQPFELVRASEELEVVQP